MHKATVLFSWVFSLLLGQTLAWDSGWPSTWKPSEPLRQWFPAWIIGKDDAGASIHWNPPGNWQELAQSGTDEQKQEFHKHFDAIGEKIIASSRANSGAVFILDLKGFIMDDPEMTMLALQVLPVIGEISDFLKQAYFINVDPGVAKVLEEARPLVKNSAKNIQVYGTNASEWKTKLGEAIPKELLPVEYGGAATDE